MSKVGAPEKVTQKRIIKLFEEELGYVYLGDWQDRENNSNIEEEYLKDYLDKAGYTSQQISKALDRLSAEASHPNRSLYDNNQAVYSLLRYGAKVKAAVGVPAERMLPGVDSEWSESQAYHLPYVPLTFG